MKLATASSSSLAAALAFASMLFHGAGIAAPLYSGMITGTFTAPVFSGVYINPDGSTTALDNTGTAVFSGVGTSQIAWGNCDATCGPVPSIQSVVTFTGLGFIDAAPGVTFKLGTLSYLNGTSLSDTLIFGAVFSVGVTGSPVAIGPAIAHMSMFSTINGGADAFANADFLGFDVLPPTFHVFEGATAVVDVYGYIDVDSHVVLGTLALPPDQAGNGFLPEPGILALLGLGLAVLGLNRWITGPDGNAGRLRVRPAR